MSLREAWADLLRRRAALAPTLALVGEVLERWAVTSSNVTPLGWSKAECLSRWQRGVPLLAEAPLDLSADDLEPLLGLALDLIATVREDARPALQRFAEAWDAGDVGPVALLPSPGRIGRLSAGIGLEEGLAAFAAVVALRPALEAYLATCREHVAASGWRLGVCPLCGAPPAWSDIGEDGSRRLACHLCGGAWSFSRVQCPFCGHEASRELTRLEPGQGEEGYSIFACTRCRAYVKELDRRVRWNGGPPIVEDWGSPHFDLAARQAGYWRPLPPPVLLARSRTAE